MDSRVQEAVSFFNLGVQAAVEDIDTGASSRTATLACTRHHALVHTRSADQTMRASMMSPAAMVGDFTIGMISYVIHVVCTQSSTGLSVVSISLLLLETACTCTRLRRANAAGG